ncbi:MAG: 50S ribosomal protein L17 [Halobacteriovoraceae bacterium]|nr:50S ribosomal protein L17 [Halobacteriovoraceae bacterium]
MRHQKRKYRIGTSPSHRKAIVKSLAVGIIEHGNIKTTHAKCKAIQPIIEKLITIAKVDSVANRRLVYSKLNNKTAVRRLFDEVAPLYKERNGGYTRVLKLAEARVGDNAPQSIIALV